MKEIQKMSDEELREHLNEIRLKRKTGYDRKPRSSEPRGGMPKTFKGLSNDLAALILDELKKRGGGKSKN